METLQILAREAAHVTSYSIVHCSHAGSLASHREAITNKRQACASRLSRRISYCPALRPSYTNLFLHATMSLSLFTTDADDSSYAHSTSQTDFTSKILSPPSYYMYSGVYKQDVVGQDLIQKASQQAYMDCVQTLGSGYVNENAGYSFPGHQAGVYHDSYAYASTGPQQWYPDPEHIRHLHTLYSLLPHIQPERKLNALDGPEMDIVDGHGYILFRAVPKKLLILFLSRSIIRKFLRTISREDNEGWSGLPTQQLLVLPHGIASKAAITILVSWMTRACKSATMYTMKQLRIPTNLFVVCSLAQTLALFSLHKDAFRLDSAIAQQFHNRPIHAVELEALWNCMGEESRYVYACIRAVSYQERDERISEELRKLGEKHPRLWARICDQSSNERHKPEFERRWSADLGGDDHTGDSQYPGTHSRSIRALDPAAPTFQPTGIQSLE